jgi:GNAT superfamily N-acetyltransferase
MNILAVLPTYQRLGLGAALLAPVLRLADREGKKTYIEASETGEKLYRRLGWVETGDTISLDFTGFGAEGKVDILLMMREPGAGITL